MLTGLSSAAAVFLVASGLSIIFGVTRVVNFSHGSFYMLGAFFAYTFTSYLTSVVGFWLAMLLSAIAVGLVGVVVEIMRPGHELRPRPGLMAGPRFELGTHGFSIHCSTN